MVYAQKKILIIEDNKVARESLDQTFRGAGFIVFSTELGSEGLTIARREKPTIILLDVMLPDIDGLDVLKKITSGKETKNCKVVIFTNLSDESTISRIVKAGGRDYLVKSDFSLGDIVKKIEEILKR